MRFEANDASPFGEYVVVVPTTLQLKVLEELHGGHIGVVKMKALARSHVW